MGHRGKEMVKFLVKSTGFRGQKKRQEDEPRAKGLLYPLPFRLRRKLSVFAEFDVATDEISAIVLNEKELDRMMTDSQSIVLMAMQHLSSRLRNMTEDYLGACRMLKRMSDAEGKGPGLTEDQMREIDNYISISMMNSYVLLL